MSSIYLVNTALAKTALKNWYEEEHGETENKEFEAVLKSILLLW